MTDRALCRGVIAISAVNAGMLVGANVFALMAAGPDKRFVAWEIFIRLLLTPFLAIGLVVGLRHPRNKVGWLFMGGTTAILVNELALGYATYAIDNGVKGGALAAWVSSWVWVLTFGAIGALFLVFPTGRAPSPRWRVVGWALALGLILNVLGNALTLRPLDHFEPLINPFGVSGSPASLVQVAMGLGGALVGGSIMFSGVSLVLRFRRSVGEERQQLKWFVFAAAIVSVSVFGLGATYRDGVDPSPIVLFFQVTTFVSVLFLATAVGVAILKYRLYDIDVIINRALVYAVLTSILGAAYVGLVFGFQTVLRPFTSESDLAVAASTLAVAALFRPVRGRVQDFIDRRFYRRKFDVQRTLEEFGHGVRDEVDLAALSQRFTDIVAMTMQPRHVSLWIREAR